MTTKKWETYEQVAAYLLNQFCEHFGMSRFEGKQSVDGESGTSWEIDAKGIAEDGTKFIVVECKRHTKNGISQAITAGLAWSIQDTGAFGGILVSPIGLQEGAKKVAKQAGVVEVILDENSTKTEYMMQFLNDVCVGFLDSITAQTTESLSIEVRDKDGNLVEKFDV